MNIATNILLGICRLSNGNFLPDVVTCTKGNCDNALDTNMILTVLQLACSGAGVPISGPALLNAESIASATGSASTAYVSHAETVSLSTVGGTVYGGGADPSSPGNILSTIGSTVYAGGAGPTTGTATTGTTMGTGTTSTKGTTTLSGTTSSTGSASIIATTSTTETSMTTSITSSGASKTTGSAAADQTSGKSVNPTATGNNGSPFGISNSVGRNERSCMGMVVGLSALLWLEWF